ncbi:MAG: helix-turn-helix transcriptional regulator [Clostridia bacterium]|jgi:transcriptional regulator with XRE-family HTH domain|nr:helix-turn-helix transcriptional regulator [Clostridia bacterium]MBP5779954.1 helix-turn-helix transcriptional regulator [Clostridia bacterium]MBR6934594.1 helix-turn-helix transcriptional regulator [Clostridia bacterium]
MDLDYEEIGRRIARRRKDLGLKQAEVEERAGIGYKYLSSIENASSIPSVEVVMKLAKALDTTPDEFLVGTSRSGGEWVQISEMLRCLTPKQLDFVKAIVMMVQKQDL